MGSIGWGEAANHNPIAGTVASGPEVFLLLNPRLLLLLDLRLSLLLKTSRFNLCRIGADKDIVDQTVVNRLGQLY